MSGSLVEVDWQEHGGGCWGFGVGGWQGLEEAVGVQELIERHARRVLTYLRRR